MVKKALLGQVGDTEIRLLRIFKTVVACGGLAAAELELNIGRSTVSRHLKDLEQRLGLVLCRRGRAGFALTADGQRVYEGALKLLETLDGFRSEVQDLHADLQGQLTLGLFDKTATNPRCQIHRAIAEFGRSAPRVRLELTLGALNQLENAVLDGRLQVAVAPDHRRSDSLVYHPLFEENMFLYCGAGHPLWQRAAEPAGLNWEPVRQADYAGLAFHSPNMEVTHRLRLHRTATVTDQEALATLLLSGRYIGFLPDHYAALFESAGRLRRLALPDATYRVQFVAISRAWPGPSRIGRAFLAALRAAHAPTLGESGESSESGQGLSPPTSR
jgi:DNA-binding transcriptional LysR family regulator